MNNISFKSRIRPVGHWEFQRLTSGINKNQFVNYPWTVSEGVVSNKACTKNVFDCTVCGITDGLKVLMMHICPTKKENGDFSKIIDFIKKNIVLKDVNLQGFLFGSRKNTSDDRSGKIFKSFETFLQENNIPFSKLKGSKTFGDVAYSSETDEWLIKLEDTERGASLGAFKNSAEYLKHYFDEVKVCDLDEIV